MSTPEDLVRAAELVTELRVGALRAPTGEGAVLLALRTAKGVRVFRIPLDGAGALEVKLGQARREASRIIVPPAGWRPNGNGG